MNNAPARLIDAASTHGAVNSIESISMQEIQSRAQLNAFSGCTLIVLPLDCPVALYATNDNHNLLQFVPSVAKSPAQNIFWVEFEALHGPPAKGRIAPENPTPSPPLQAMNGHDVSQNGQHTQTSDAMTSKQRRFLFRLLAEKGHKANRAEDYLLQYFKVQSVSAISKQAASTLIDHLVNGESG